MKIFKLIVRIVVFGTLFFLLYDLFGPSVIVSTDMVQKEYQPLISSQSYSHSYNESNFGQNKETFQSAHETRGYNAYAPSNLGEGKHPVIFLFHGRGRTGASMVERWKRVADRQRVILIAPHGLAQSWGNGTDYSSFIPSLIRDVGTKYPIDPRRMFLFGHSDGATFTTHVALQYPTAFVAASHHGGAPDARTLRLSQSGRKIPIQYILGTNDSIFPVWYVQKTAYTLNQSGHETEFVLLSGHTHWYYDLAPQINAIAWAFFERWM
jgi:poly(3-hydroxybutyrate) depolymerase